MTHLTAGLGTISAAMLCIAGCSPASSGPLAPLSGTDRAANAPAIAELVDRLCIADASRPDDFPAALRQTGWPQQRTQTADGMTALDGWKLPHIELVHAAAPTVTPKAKTWTCMVAVDAAASPSTAQIEAALRGKAGREIFDIRTADWRWKPSWLTEGHIMITPNMAGGQSIFVEIADRKPLNALFGS